MRYSLLVAVLIALPFSSTPLSAADICDRALEKEEPSFLHKISFGTFDSKWQNELGLSQSERIDIACQMRNSLLRQYSLVELKRERLGLDVKAHLTACVVRETEVEDNNRLRFEDRIRKCVAALRDTHLSGEPRQERPVVLTAVDVALIDGKVLVVEHLSKLISLVEKRDQLKDLAQAIPVGSELLEIDGVETKVWQDELMAYGAQSSYLGRRIGAAGSLLYRSFLYPKRSFVDLKVKLANGTINQVRLPWFSLGVTNNAVANAELAAVGIKPLEEIQLTYDETSKKWEDLSFIDENVYRASTPLVAEGLKIYKKAGKKDIAIRAGEVIQSRNRAFCYLQLRTFMVEDVEAPDGSKAGFIETLKGILESCESKELPLLLDLRANGGGISTYPAKLMALLTPRGQKSMGVVRAYRANKHVATFFSQNDENYATGAKVFKKELSFDRSAQALLKALRAGASHTDVILEEEIEPALANGFNQPMVALVTTGCVSACDITAALIKANKRGKLIGTHTSGTGAGMWESGPSEASFADSYQVFKFQVPITLFGVLTRPDERETIPYAEGKELLMENRPVPADVNYDTTVTDVLTRNKGWLEVAVRELMKEVK